MSPYRDMEYNISPEIWINLHASLKNVNLIHSPRMATMKKPQISLKSILRWRSQAQIPNQGMTTGGGPNHRLDFTLGFDRQLWAVYVKDSTGFFQKKMFPVCWYFNSCYIRARYFLVLIFSPAPDQKFILVRTEFSSEETDDETLWSKRSIARIELSFTSFTEKVQRLVSLAPVDFADTFLEERENEETNYFCFFFSNFFI